MERLALFTVVKGTYLLVADWAKEAGYELALMATVFGRESSPGFPNLNDVEPDTTVIVTPKVRDCRGALAEAGVDLGIVFNYPIVPEDIAGIPRLGCVNMHPSLLPRHRGANGFRSLYEPEPVIGATVHWLTGDVDGGDLLAQASVPTPEDIDPITASEAFAQAARMALTQGVPRAFARDAGEPQDFSTVSDALRFTEEESILGTDLTTHVFQCRFSALCLAGIQPQLALGDERHPMRTVRRLPGLSGTPGFADIGSRRGIVAVADGVLELDLGRLPF